MTILIAGAGIGGLTLALGLHSVGIRSKIFEAVSQIRPLGVGINIQPHAVRELEALGLLPKLDAIALRTKEVAYFSSHGQKIWSEPRGKFAGYNWPQFSIHRGKLQMLLLDEVRKRLGEGAIVTGAAVENWKETRNGIEIELYDRQECKPVGKRHGKILVGADGIHSTVRSFYYPEEKAPKWGGIIMWRGVTRASPFLTGRTMAMAGCKQRKFVCYPIEESGEETLINWIADLGRPENYLWNREDWNRPGRQQDFLPRFANWNFDWLNIPQIISQSEHIFEFPMVDRDPLPCWTFGRVTLLGDAAHPMYPIGSNGATQAIIDAMVLTRELKKFFQTGGISKNPIGAEAISSALSSYETERNRVTAKIVLANRGDGPDIVMDIVEQRAPDGFERLADVLSDNELSNIASSYKKIAGFDIETLNKARTLMEL